MLVTGAYLGLTPKRYQSGEVDLLDRISKFARIFLYEAAGVMLTGAECWSPLKACGRPADEERRRHKG